ncbi:MAG: hypothetical protein R3C52_04785 [Hyphomonadaceae bacterium]
MFSMVRKDGTSLCVRALAPALAMLVVLSACGQNDAADPQAGAGETQADSLDADVPPAAEATESTRPSVLARTAPLEPEVLDTSAWSIQPPFYAVGDEPFWRLEMIDGWFVFRRSGLPEIEAPIANPEKAAGGDHFDVTPLDIVITPGRCTTLDGEAGVAQANVTFDGGSYEGCVFTGAVGGSSAEATAVIDAIPAIDSCLARLGEPAVVTSIFPREDNRTSMGLRTHDGRLYECAAEQGTGEIAFLDAQEPNSASSWLATRMRFLRAGVEGFPDCEDMETVTSGDTVLGVLLGPKCKF